MRSRSPVPFLFPGKGGTLWLLERFINIQPQPVPYHTDMCKPLYLRFHPLLKDMWAVFNPPRTAPEHTVVIQHHGHSDTQLKEEVTAEPFACSESQNPEHLTVHRGTLVHREFVTC